MFYLGRGRMGIAYLVAGIAVTYAVPAALHLQAISYPSWMAILMGLAFRLAGGIHAYIAASNHVPRDRYPWFAKLHNWILVFFLVPLLTALIIRNFLVQPFNIPSGSMMPTLQVGDFLFSEKLTYGISRYSLMFGMGPSHRLGGRPPKRGEVVVFAFPAEPTVDYVSRVIGQPGDRIQMRDGRLFINGVMVERQPLITTDIPHEAGVTLYMEHLPGGVVHPIIEMLDDTSRGDNTREFLVPDDHYFMMGDNRDNSRDSRFDVGFVPNENIASRPWLIYFNSEVAGRSWLRVQ
ncbi:signal peptidase I [Ciceribacter ferrooxidans]|uniref:Signal peptidase I n=1 Tax=Ciceribacter ferrooxidans TaxID=2509717 RepID=A0A4Q2TGI9_9HYPH|nr:signal peptidase I [Ciceribacter ferrooxidans]RYC17508.1 signal peptidase I [Ciceribacter ferrooxidans]